MVLDFQYGDCSGDQRYPDKIAKLNMSGTEDKDFSKPQNIVKQESRRHRRGFKKLRYIA